MAAEAILMVDDEEFILSSYQRVLRKQFQFDVASSGQLALDKMASDGPYALLLCDMRMPGMSGLELLRKVMVSSPQTIRIMLTGNSDIRTAIDAVNEGSVFRFLTKPCEPDVLAAAIKDGLRNYRLIEAERELLEGTLQGVIRLLTEVLSLVNPLVFSETLEVSKYVKNVVEQMGIEDSWQYEIAALLANLGSVVVASEPLTADASRFGAHSDIAERLLSKIPRLEKVAAIIGQLGAKELAPNERLSDPLRIGANILYACAVFHDLMLQGLSSPMAVKKIRESGRSFHPGVLDALQNLPIVFEYQARVVTIKTLARNMRFDEDLCSTTGTLLVANGTSITDSLLIRLHNFSQQRVLPADIRMRIPVARLK